MVQPTRIIIIRFSSIGDIVLTTPVIRMLKQQLDGEVQVDFITKKPFATLLEPNPHISEVITIEKSVSEVADRLRDGLYDYVIDLHSNIRSKQVKRLCKALSFTLDKRNIAKWLYIQTKKEIMSIGHVADRSIETIKALGIQDDNKGLDYFFPENSEVSVNMLPETHRNGYIAYAIGGQMKGKILPTSQMIDLVKRVDQAFILLGATEDRDRGDEVVQAIGPRVFNACGAFSLHQSSSLLRSASKVLTHDTGLMHIATALHVPVVSLWLATTPELGFAPWRAEAPSVMIEADCSKRPTSKLGNRGYKDGCVFNVDLKAVAKVLNA